MTKLMFRLYFRKVLFSVCFIVCCCQFSFAQSNFTEKKIGHEYFLSIPDYLLRCSGLNDQASVQYQNNSKEIYLYVIEDAKEELKSVGILYQNIAEFYDDFIKDYATDTKGRKLSAPQTIKNGTTTILHTEMEYIANETPIYMVITIVEGKDYFYKIISWTSLSNKEKLKDDMLKIGSSFREN